MRSSSHDLLPLNLSTLIIAALASAAFINAAMYISYAGIPFITSDGWYFVDTFLQKYYHGGVTLHDLYMKRSTDDHAQPIHKLLLIWNADHFDLDFVIESYVGLAIAGVSWLLMLYSARQDNVARSSAVWWILPMVAAAFSLVSLSGGMVFSWSLVTLSYLGPLSMVLMAFSAWHAVERHRWLPLLILAPLIVFTMDGTALICAISVSCALLLREAKMRGKTWRATFAALSLVAATVIAYRLVSHFYLHPQLADAPAAPPAIATLLGFGWSRIQQMVLAIASLSIAEPAALAMYLHDRSVQAHRLIGLLVIMGHAWFWWRASRDQWNRTQFIAVTLMLFCYGAAAGIVLGRVPIFGPEYVTQQRYLLMYQLGTVALAMMAAGSNWHDWRLPQRAVAAVALAGVILIQLPLSLSTWREAPFVQAYGNKLGRQIILLGENPGVRLAGCAPMLVICQASRDEQIRSIELLRGRRLNAFSRSMLRRHSMESLQQNIGPAEVISATTANPSGAPDTPRR
ncbi:hypothetical protein [Stenotrophomonas rhizophila]|uniref:Uncharacterized protein n=1 Tax=Stenotrophomonas rhizophila TaxID=216778 RepID=A0A7V7YFD2_9GAMM|nr:hypothetical protein [Stenotrophomonas rhizophila]KAB7629947.1 hypothetical protein F9K92_12105 [Stenotrophomonas rhizophila]